MWPPHVTDVIDGPQPLGVEQDRGRLRSAAQTQAHEGFEVRIATHGFEQIYLQAPGR